MRRKKTERGEGKANRVYLRRSAKGKAKDDRNARI